MDQQNISSSLCTYLEKGKPAAACAVSATQSSVKVDAGFDRNQQAVSLDFSLFCLSSPSRSAGRTVLMISPDRGDKMLADKIQLLKGIIFVM